MYIRLDIQEYIPIYANLLKKFDHVIIGQWCIYSMVVHLLCTVWYFSKNVSFLKLIIKINYLIKGLGIHLFNDDFRIASSKFGEASVFYVT